MDSGIIQFPSYPPEVSYSGNQRDPETDLMDYFSLQSFMSSRSRFITAVFRKR